MKLTDVLAADDTVLFVGSGASAWSGLPSWTGLLSELANYLDEHSLGSEMVRAEMVRGDLLQAASYGFDKLTRPRVGEFMRRACRYGIAQPSPLHQAIVALGPRCYITTNYDNLLEEALRRWRPDESYPPAITNKQLLETAEIIQARATNFIYKPHGDASDADSIIITREHYRTLLQDGERHAALDALKTLLVSRPVVYVGFGLRDPDFLFIRDVLFNLYKGGTRDHYAFMADVTSEEIQYWRKNYGIQLVPYQTLARPDGGRDHTPLLSVLQGLAHAAAANAVESRSELVRSEPEILLALTRYAATLARATKVTPELPIRVHKNGGSDGSHFIPREFDRLDGKLVEDFLDRFTGHVALVGLPGAGKSYALRQAASRWADRLHTACLEENATTVDLVLPIFADLKLYEGSLFDLLSSSLPPGVDLQALRLRSKLRIFIDSFNEVPRRFVESGDFQTDLSNFLEHYSASDVVVGTRIADGLDNLATYELCEIERNAVSDELARHSIALSGRFADEIQTVLQRPFFFRYVIARLISIPQDPAPSELYKEFFRRVGERLNSRFGCDIDASRLLRSVAYSALNSGEEAFPLSVLLRAVQAKLPHTRDGSLQPTDVANWLVSECVLMPFSGSRVAFVHQSLTEYLAAIELSERFAASPQILSAKLKLRRWDQALFLALSLLSESSADDFFQRVVKADIGLALSAAKFLETDRDAIIARLLEALLQTNEEGQSYTLNWSFRGLPLSAQHVPLLWKFLSSDHELADGAAVQLAHLLGSAVKKDLIAIMWERHGDYNLGANAIGPAIRRFAALEDLSLIAEYAQQGDFKLVQAGGDVDRFHGFSTGAAEFISDLPFSAVRAALMPMSEADLRARPVTVEILREYLKDRRSSDALRCALELVRLGDCHAAVVVYFILEFRDAEAQLELQLITDADVQCLADIFEGATENESDVSLWALDALRTICAVRNDLCRAVESRATHWAGLKRIGLLRCIKPETDAMSGLLELASMSNGQLAAEHVEQISHWELNWSGNESIMLSLLRRRDKRLASALLSGGVPTTLDGFSQVDVGDIHWWLDWIRELAEPDFWTAWKLSSFIARYADERARRRLVSEFNDPASAYRGVLLGLIMPFIPSITTDDLSDSGVAYALEAAAKEGSNRPFSSFLGGAATEAFVTDRLLPCVLRLPPDQATGVRRAIDQAGLRHGRRYLL